MPYCALIFGRTSDRAIPAKVWKKPTFQVEGGNRMRKEESEFKIKRKDRERLLGMTAPVGSSPDLLEPSLSPVPDSGDP